MCKFIFTCYYKKNREHQKYKLIRSKHCPFHKTMQWCGDYKHGKVRVSNEEEGKEPVLQIY